MITLFLATIIGWYLIILSLFLLFRFEQAQTATKEIMKDRGSFLIVALITVISGLLLVASHNEWVMGWPVVITLFSWLVLLGGILRLFFPEVAIKMGQSFLKNPFKIKVSAVISLILGAFLLAHVYFNL